MKIRLDSNIFNDIIKFATNFVAKGRDARPVLTQVLLEVEDGQLKATALDGHKLGQIIFTGDWEDGTMIIPLVKRVRESEYVVIEDDGENIRFESETGTQIYKKKESQFFNYKDALPKSDPKETFSMTAGNIAKALSAFHKDEVIDIKYRGEVDPLIIESHTKMAVVLPVRRAKR